MQIYPPDQLADLMGSCDYLVAALPATPATRKFVSAAAIRALQPHAVFINLGRGTTVDEEALAEGASSPLFPCLSLHGYTLRVCTRSHCCSYLITNPVQRLRVDSMYVSHQSVPPDLCTEPLRAEKYADWLLSAFTGSCLPVLHGMDRHCFTHSIQSLSKGPSLSFRVRKRSNDRLSV